MLSEEMNTRISIRGGLYVYGDGLDHDTALSKNVVLKKLGQNNFQNLLMKRPRLNKKRRSWVEDKLNFFQ